MILDTSAIISMIEEEAGSRDLLRALAAAPSVAVGAPTLFEATMVLVGKTGAAGRRTLARFLEVNRIASLPFDERHLDVAADAFVRYGKGRHRARLNFGDCMTYATARIAGEPLLCVGDDFAKTDLVLAPA